MLSGEVIIRVCVWCKTYRPFVMIRLYGVKNIYRPLLSHPLYFFLNKHTAYHVPFSIIFNHVENVGMPGGYMTW